ncbi:PEP-CTERM sorting domain-containing protein [Thalassotalea sp. PLHSN55]|uniref:PEP-CTERM sorting domain-containing protein n=1 Tax=Thalassotalea sp. PLHSN55 TaxID=3435888 RepID=UPI003F873FBD
MNIKMLKAACVGLVLSASNFANAGIIEATIDTLNDGFTDTVSGITYWDINKFYNMDVATIESQGFTLDTFNNASNLFDNIIAEYPISSDRDAAFDIMGSLEDYIWIRWDDGVANANDDGGFIYTSTDTKHIFNNTYDYTRDTFGALVQSSASAPVPEPSTLAIFALGILGLASRKFKKV